jgi:cystatin-A/B
MAISDLEIKFF